MDPQALRKRQRTEQVLHERTSLLQLQQVMAAAANEASTIDEAMEAALNLICSYTGWPMGHALFTGDGGHHRLVFTGLWHSDDSTRFAPLQKLADSKSSICRNDLAAEVFKTGKPAWTADIAERCDCEWAKVAKEVGLGAALAFPVWVGKETVAVLEFFSEKFEKPDEQLLQVLNYVGTQLGRTIERKRAEAALRGGEERFRALIENANDVISIVDSKGVILYESPAIERMLGYTQEELLGKNAFDFIHPDDQEQVQAVFAQVLEKPGHSARSEFDFRHKDGSWRTLEAVGKNPPEDAKVAGIIINSRDITERKQMEETLRRSERRLKQAQTVGRIGDWELDVATGEIRWSEQMFALFGLGLADGTPTYEKFLSYLAPDDAPRLHQLVQRAIETGKGFETDLHFNLPSGQDVHQFCVCITVTDSTGQVTKLRGIGQDITERKQAETVLAEGEQKYRVLIEQSPDTIITADQHWNIRFVNPAGCEMLGYTQEELLRLNIVDTYAPEDRDVAVRRNEESRIGKTQRFERNVRRKDGTCFPAEVILHQIEKGRFQGIVRDITARKQAEENLRLQSAALESAANGIVITDRNGIIQWVNPAFTTLTGYTAEEAIGQNPRILKSGKQDEKRYAEIWQAITSGQIWRGEIINRRKDGNLYTEEMTITPLCNAAGEITRFIAIKQDVTERKRTEEAMQRMAAIVESSDDAIIAKTLDGVITSWNSGAEKLFGYSAKEVVGQPIRMLVPPERGTEEADIVERLMRGESVDHFETVRVRKGGQQIDVSLTISPIRDSHGNIVGASKIARDITARKQTDEALQDANRRLEKALAELKDTQQQVIQQERLGALGTMASGIAHDFNNALAAILGFSELLLYRPACLEDKEKARRYIEMMNTAAKDAGDVVNRLREFYRHREEGEVFAPVDLNRLAEDAVSLTEPKWKAQAEANGISITIQKNLQPIPAVAGNAANLREMLTNLIFNAVDAMPRGGTITLRTRRENDQVVLEVGDTGTGMTEEVRHRCLEPFFTTKGERGTGLGLSMVYGIVQRHEGEIDIQTAKGQGTTFIIRLPQHTARLPSQPERVDQPASQAAAFRILVVDDEPLTGKVIGEYLKLDGHAVEIATNGGGGLEKFRQSHFDLVIVDRAMPDMSGDQVASTIKALSPATPIIMLTGFGSMMEAADEKPANVDLVVGKPVTIADLRRALMEVTMVANANLAEAALEGQSS